MSVLLSLVPWWGRWVALGLLILAAAAFGAAKMHAHDEKAYDALAGQFSAFRATVQAQGEQAQRDALAKESADKQRKETADHENATALATLAADVKRLRDANDSTGGLVPAAPAGSRRPDLACFDRSEYQRAIGDFISEARRGADEGSTATVDLDTAKKWASGAETGQ